MLPVASTSMLTSQVSSGSGLGLGLGAKNLGFAAGEWALATWLRKPTAESNEFAHRLHK